MLSQVNSSGRAVKTDYFTISRFTEHRVYFFKILLKTLLLIPVKLKGLNLIKEYKKSRQNICHAIKIHSSFHNSLLSHRIVI